MHTVLINHAHTHTHTGLQDNTCVITGTYAGGGTGVLAPQWLHDSRQLTILLSVSGEAILSARERG